MLTNMRIATRQALAIGLLLVFMAGLTAKGYIALGGVWQTAARLSELAQRLRVHVVGCRRYEKDLGDGEADRKWAEERGALMASLDDADAIAGDADKPMLTALRDDFARYADGYRHGRLATAPYEEITRRLDDTSLRFADLRSEELRLLSQKTRHTLVVMVAIAAFTSLLAMLIGWRLVRAITVPVAEIVDLARRIAAGDLRGRLFARRGDELGLLQSAISDMLAKLGPILGEVRSGADALAVASSHVSASSQSLSQGTSEQAASVEETSSSLEEMSASITQNADNSRHLEETALKGASDAGEAARTVADAAAAMRSIVEKISVVEEIAYQTNMLALNAAIEAARAGE
ncbi:MAG TPA: methyl-accepting chemotaxis protein, partial [Polyangia bacterium]